MEDEGRREEGGGRREEGGRRRRRLFAIWVGQFEMPNSKR
jgi:hypothetical protein